MSESLKNLVELFHIGMLVASIAVFLVGLILLVLYYVRYSSLKELKDKYEFASLKEIKAHRNFHILVAIAGALFMNTLRPELIHQGIVLLFVRFSMAAIAGTLYGYVASLVLKFYYPTRLSKKLKKLRYSPRINPKTGNKMKLLSEDEEDVYLDEGQRAEEDAFSIDYDVWLDSESGDTKVEKYMGHLTALECDRCGFMTLKIEKEEVVKEATEEEDGELVSHYKCSYCNRIKHQSKKIAKIGSSIEIPDLPQFKDPLLADSVVLVKVEIHGMNGQIKNYEFQNTEQAEMFLKEFDFNKVE